MSLLKAYIEREEELGEATAAIDGGRMKSVICSGEPNELKLNPDDGDNGFLGIGGYVTETGLGLNECERAEFLDLAQEFSSLFTEIPETTNLFLHHINLQ